MQARWIRISLTGEWAQKLTKDLMTLADLKISTTFYPFFIDAENKRKDTWIGFFNYSA